MLAHTLKVPPTKIKSMESYKLRCLFACIHQRVRIFEMSTGDSSIESDMTHELEDGTHQIADGVWIGSVNLQDLTLSVERAPTVEEWAAHVDGHFVFEESERMLLDGLPN